MSLVHLDTLDPADRPDLADYTSLTDVALRAHDEPGRAMYLAESAQVIRRAIEAGHQPRSLLMAPRWLESMADVIAMLDDDAPVYVAEEPLLEQITGFNLHRGPIAAMHRPVLPPVSELLAELVGAHPDRALRIVVLEDSVDHTNVGAAFRAAAALGVDMVLVTPRCADPLYRRAVRVSMGTVFQVPWTRLEAWPHRLRGSESAGGVDLLREHGFTVAALAIDEDSLSLDDFVGDLPQRLALVFGTEGHGLRRTTIAACDLTVRIPMSGGVDSLNLAASVAVTAWAVRGVLPQG